MLDSTIKIETRCRLSGGDGFLFLETSRANWLYLKISASRHCVLITWVYNHGTPQVKGKTQWHTSVKFCSATCAITATII
jgi:hypothetical protein